MPHEDTDIRYQEERINNPCYGQNSEVDKRKGKSLSVLFIGLEIVGCLIKCKFPRKLSFERSGRLQVSSENSTICMALSFH